MSKTIYWHIDDFKNPHYGSVITHQFNETILGAVFLNITEQNEMFAKVGFKDIQRLRLTTFDMINLVK